MADEDNETLSKLSSFTQSHTSEVSKIKDRLIAEGAATDDAAIRAEMRFNRGINKNAVSVGSSGMGQSSQMSFATGRPRDPMFYWRENNLPYDLSKDEELKKIRAFCSEEHEPILMADFTFKPIGEVQPGEMVIGWESYQTPSGKTKTRLVQTEVLATLKREAPEVVEMTMDSGKTVRCTPDHKWANYAYSPSTANVETTRQTIDERLAQQELRLDAVILFESGHKPKQVSEKLETPHNTVKTWYQRWKRDESLVSDRPWANRQAHLEWVNPEVGIHIRRVAEPVVYDLTPEQQIAAAYLAAMIDGEGWVDKKSRVIGIAQSRSVNPDVCDAITNALETVGLPYIISSSTASNGTEMMRWMLRGDSDENTREATIRAINILPSVKLRRSDFHESLLISNFGAEEIVTSVEPMGPGIVVSMQTGTGNYIVAGLASSNCRLLYVTHPFLSSAIDVMSKYPVLDMEFRCKDEALVEFYSDLFIDQLEYEEFLIDIGREYWTVGEAWPLGSFNELLGVWEADELINPDDVEVIRSPFLKEPRFEMALPEDIRRIIRERDPKWEYEALMKSYPELAHFTGEDDKMPVSNILLKQIAFKGDSFHPRGIPILMRGFRAIIQEEMLNAAQDAIAERLYTPLIIAKLGASASDLGTSVPWIPTMDDRASFEEALDAALAGDFRVLITHFATEVKTVFGKEAMPNFTPEFDRLNDRQLQIFGMSRTMLSGASGGQTYAADALNRDLLTQLLTTYQRKIKNFVRDRMLVVAEAQEHYDYEERGGIKYPIMEEILIVDEETGEHRIVEQPKLLVPEVQFKTMNIANEKEERQLLETLRASGVPISMRTRLTNIPIDLADEMEVSKQEQIDLAVEAEEARKQTYLALRGAGLPIPEDLIRDFQPKAQQKDQGNPHQPGTDEEMMPLPSLGLDQPAPTTALVPTDDDLADTEGESDAGMNEAVTNEESAAPNVSRLPQNKFKNRPPESDEQRANMPKASSVDPGLMGPRHIGMRKNRRIDPNVPLDEQV